MEVWENVAGQSDVDLDLTDVCTSVDIGNPKGGARVVTGGLLHQMWRFETERGEFALKVLNSEIMSRPDAKQNYRNAETVAKTASQHGIRAVIAKTVGDDPWVEINGKHVMVFDWIEGCTLLPEECTVEQARSIGGVLCQIHNAAIEIDGLESPNFSTVPEATWKSHIEKARRVNSCWGFPWETLVHDISQWSRLYLDSVDKLSQQWVVSHRDLDSKNVIWTNTNTPYLIDWESAGYVNPAVELIEAAVNWSRNRDGTADKERFQAVVQTYFKAGGMMHGKALDAVYGTLGGMLGWLEYNMRRCLDEVFSNEDRELGHREVKQTVRELRNLNDAAFEFAKWVEESYL